MFETLRRFDREKTLCERNFSKQPHKMLFFLPIYGMEHTMDSLKIYERLKMPNSMKQRQKNWQHFSPIQKLSPASKQDLRETELRSVREMKEMELRLSREIEDIRSSTVPLGRWSNAS